MATAIITITDMTEAVTDGDGQTHGTMAVMVQLDPKPDENGVMYNPPMTHRAAMAALEAISAMPTTDQVIDVTPPNPASDWSI